MKQFVISALLMASFSSTMFAQPVATALSVTTQTAVTPPATAQQSTTQVTDSIVYTDATQLRIVNRGFMDVSNPYQRLPEAIKPTVRDEVWDLAGNSAGIAIRFRTNSPFVAARYKLTHNLVMNHMAPTGIKGLDLYALTDAGTWRYVITGRPTGRVNELVLIRNMESQEREYMLYLPLYDGVEQLEIGVSRDARIDAGGEALPVATYPLVFYGTSITQGGCASRPGMAYTNILSRKLQREVINLGFSGNGKLDLDVAEQLARLNPSVYVIDCLPNCDAALIRRQGLEFLTILRKAHPEVPIVMTEGPYYPHQDYDQKLRALIAEKLEAWKDLYRQLEATYPGNLYYIESLDFAGDDYESAVDGTHLTDLGFQRVAERLESLLGKLIGSK